MGSAVSRYLPLDMALLCLIEFALSFTVIHFMLATPPLPLAVGALSQTRQVADLAAILALSVGAVTLVIGSYQPQYRFNRISLLSAACIAGLVAFPLLLLVSNLYAEYGTTGRVILLAKVLGVWVAAIGLFRLLYSFVMQRLFPMRRVLIVGEPARVEAFSTRLDTRQGRRFEGLVAPAVSGDSLAWDRLHHQRVWGVVLTANAEPAVVQPLLDCKLRGMRIISDRAFQERHLGRLDLNALTVDDLLLGEGFAGGAVSAAAKRACDIVVSVGLLLLTLPLMLLVALAIKCDSPGPVFYRQQRTGYLGRPFTLFKFRSMSVDAEAGGAPRWAQKQDPRITRVGSFIRATRIDELPQLMNVIHGQMSLVGPRPERPHFVEQLAKAIPFYQERSYVKPGVTGWAQVNFPYGASVEDAREKLSYDLYYVKHRSLLLDLFILFSTIRVVLFLEGSR